ncbi:hypothetical protein BJY00DRAFT_294746 [Aspergillus carlsbadensis]|nr:hypothetical protein BJY00DRAFT_294746 [Aspergillus carlsbadensis]
MFDNHLPVNSPNQHWQSSPIDQTHYHVQDQFRNPSNHHSPGEPQQARQTLLTLSGSSGQAPFHPQAPALQCKWEGCTYAGYFTRESVLLRHIRLIHLNPRQFFCLYDSRCKPFNRKDNLMTHMRKVHGAQ